MMKHGRNQLGWQKKFRVTNQPKLSSLYYFPPTSDIISRGNFYIISRRTFHLLSSRWRPCHWQTSNYWKDKNLPCHNHLHLYLHLYFIICICICICIWCHLKTSSAPSTPSPYQHRHDPKPLTSAEREKQA